MKKQKTNKSSKPQYFSDYFKIDKLKLKELGVFDPILNADSKLFIEPTLLQYSSSEIFKEAYRIYLARFKKIYQALSRS